MVHTEKRVQSAAHKIFHNHKHFQRLCRKFSTEVNRMKSESTQTYCCTQADYKGWYI